MPLLSQPNPLSHRNPRLRVVLLAALALAYGALALRPAWEKVRSAGHGRDFATYYYAVEVALDGGDPYETPLLTARAHRDRTRGGVHPYLYPPPFLLGMVWAAPLSLATAYQAWFWLNQGFLLACLWVFRRWFRAEPLLLGLLAVSFTPIPDNAKMGQANLPVLLLTAWGLWRARGTLMGMAGMAKMSPALYLAWWAARGRWRSVAVAALTAVGLSLAALPLVGSSAQIRFFTEVLPGFSSGDYNGLTVPISLPANHSMPDLFNQLWPGPDEHTLSDRARLASSGLSLALLAGLIGLSRRTRDALGDANLAGALTVLLLVMPVYTYEHHLVIALLPAAAAGQAWLDGRFARRGASAVFVAVSYFVVAWPLYWLRPFQKLFAGPEAWNAVATWMVQESKFAGLVGLGIACVVAARRSPTVPRGTAG